MRATGQAEGAPEHAETEVAGRGACFVASRWGGVCMPAHLAGPMEGAASAAQFAGAQKPAALSDEAATGHPRIQKESGRVEERSRLAALEGRQRPPYKHLLRLAAETDFQEQDAAAAEHELVRRRSRTPLRAWLCKNSACTPEMRFK